MLKLYTNNTGISAYWKSIKNEIVINSNTISSQPKLLVELFKKDYQNNDIIILDFDIFEDNNTKKKNTDDILELLSLLPKEIKIIAIVEKPKLNEGTLLIKKGCRSYLQNKVSPELLNIALETVKDNKLWLYTELTNHIISLFKSQSGNLEILNKLTKKEHDVALLVKEGKSNQEIADILDLQLVTIKKHISSIFLKLEITDRIALAILLNKKDNI